MHIEHIPIRESVGVLRSLVKATPVQRSDFMAVYRLYREHHRMRYAAKIAHEVVFQNLPF